MENHEKHIYMFVPNIFLFFFLGSVNMRTSYHTISRETYAAAMVTAQSCFVLLVSPLSKNKWVGASTRTEERVASCWISGDGLCRGEGPQREIKEAQEKVLSQQNSVPPTFRLSAPPSQSCFYIEARISERFKP